MWFVVPFYFMAIVLFKDRKNIDRFLWLYIIPLAGVIVYTVINHAIRGFEEKPAHWVMQPFYKDHTSYGALIAFYIPIILCYLWIKKIRVTAKIQFFMVLILFVVGVIFSYTRAAWVSLVGALLVTVTSSVEEHFPNSTVQRKVFRPLLKPVTVLVESAEFEIFYVSNK